MLFNENQHKINLSQAYRYGAFGGQKNNLEQICRDCINLRLKLKDWVLFHWLALTNSFVDNVVDKQKML